MENFNMPQSPSGLGRGIDPSFNTNLIIVSISIAGMLALFLLEALGGGALGASLWSGIRFGITLFAAWALAREIDPDHDYAAFVGVVVAVPAHFIIGTTGLLGCYALLSVFRMLNRVVGLRIKLIEALLLAAFMLFIAWNGQPLFLAALAVALIVDSSFSDTFKGSLWLGIGLAAIAVAPWLWSERFAPVPLLLGEWVALGAGALGWLYIILTYRTVTVDDMYAQPINNQRVQATQAVALAIIIGAVLVYGRGMFAVLLPLWAAMLGIVLFVPARGLFAR
jgi:hypothetical protein